VVNALFIEDDDMPRETALKVLDRIKRELRDGTGWDVVYRKYADECGYRTSNRTKSGLLGHLVVCTLTLRSGAGTGSTSGPTQ
jgi:hypothetical protein